METNKVTSIVGLVCGIIYETTNYDLFKLAKFNRGTEKSFIPRKLKEFLTLIDCDKFFFSLQEIKINLNGVIFEGHHRFLALKERGLPIRFIVYDDPLVNTNNDKDLLEILITFNGVRTNWITNQVFQSALQLKLPVAVAIDKLLDSLYNEYEFITATNFQPTKIIGLLTKDTRMIHGKAITLELLNDKSLVEKMKTDEFTKELDWIIEIMKLLYEKPVVAEIREIVKRVLYFVWKGLVTKSKIYHYIHKNGFNTMSKSADDINERLWRITNSPTPRNLIKVWC